MQTTGQYVVLFDGVCNFCNASINFIIDHDPKFRFRFGALQSEEGKKLMADYGLDSQYFDSVVLFHNGKYFTKSTAALNISKRLSGAWPVVYYLFIWWPPFVRNLFYDLIAKYRYRLFGKSDSCRMPTPELKERFL